MILFSAIALAAGALASWEEEGIHSDFLDFLSLKISPRCCCCCCCCCGIIDGHVKPLLKTSHMVEAGHIQGSGTGVAALMG